MSLTKPALKVTNDYARLRYKLQRNLKERGEGVKNSSREEGTQNHKHRLQLYPL